MKLRLLGNSLRLRIQQQELATLHAGDVIQEEVLFGPSPEDRFVYSLSISDTVKDLDAQYTPGHIAVWISKQVIKEMVETDRVGITGENTRDGENRISILVEKDFKCLTVREEDKDAFPHPDPDATHPTC